MCSDSAKSEEMFFDMFKRGIPVTSASVKSLMHALARQNKFNKYIMCWGLYIQRGEI